MDIAVGDVDGGLHEAAGLNGRELFGGQYLVDHVAHRAGFAPLAGRWQGMERPRLTEGVGGAIAGA